MHALPARFRALTFEELRCRPKNPANRPREARSGCSACSGCSGCSFSPGRPLIGDGFGREPDGRISDCAPIPLLVIRSLHLSHAEPTQHQSSRHQEDRGPNSQRHAEFAVGRRHCFHGGRLVRSLFFNPCSVQSCPNLLDRPSPCRVHPQAPFGDIKRGCGTVAGTIGSPPSPCPRQANALREPSTSLHHTQRPHIRRCGDDTASQNLVAGDLQLIVHNQDVRWFQVSVAQAVGVQVGGERPAGTSISPVSAAVSGRSGRISARFSPANSVTK